MESQPSDESVSALFVRSSAPPPPSPLFVPEEHNPLDDHPMPEIAIHEIDRPDTQHRNSRREERRQRETRRRQKQERRRQRESRRQQRLSNGGHEGVQRSHSVTQSHAASSRESSGNITEVEIDAGNQHEPAQPANTVEEELGGNTLPIDHTPVDPSIAEPIETEAPPEEELHEAETEDNPMVPEIVINEPSPEHIPDPIEDNSRLNDSTEGNTLPREVNEGETLVRQEHDPLAELPFDHRIENHHAILGSSRQRAVRQSRSLGLKRSAIARRQAAVRTRPGRKDRRLTQVDVKRGHQFTPDANPGAENLPPTENLAAQSPLEEVVAEERAQPLAHLEERPTTSESAVADPANPSPIPPLPSMPELIARLRESESPVEGNRGDELGNSPSDHPHEDLRQEHSEQPRLEAARPEVLTDDRESRRKVPRDKRIAEEARRRQEAKQRAENTPRAAQESENDFTQTRSGDDLFNDDDNDNSEHAPLEGNPAAATVTAGESPSTSSPSQPHKAGRKQFARHARQRPYGRPNETGQADRDRPLTQINMQLTASDQPTIAHGDPPLPTMPPIEQRPTENPPNTLPVVQPSDGSVDRRRKAANLIRERRPPVAASPHEPSKDLVIFRVWTRTRWTERTKVVVDPSDPLRCEREAKRFVEAYHAQLRDARLRILMPSQCLQSARQDGSQSVFLIFPEDRTIHKAMEEAAAAFIGFRRR